MVSSYTLSERIGATVAFKAENLQRTGSFKLRGALAKITALGDACSRGVVTGSAGNHAQAVAYAARERGLRCEVFMPDTAPIAKVEAASALGAVVHLGGANVDETFAFAHERAEQGGFAFVHPFDDPDVIAGQGGLGLELLADVPDIARVIVPVGGGGLVSGVAIALKSQRPEIEVIGVQVETCAPFPASLEAGEPVAVTSALTIADGIAVKRPGGLTLELIKRWVDGIVVVEEDDVAEAMVFLMERAKLVVEGAGAVGVAALMSERVRPRGRRNHGRDPVGRQRRRRAAGRGGAAARDPGGQAAGAAGAPARPAGSLAALLALVGEQRANLLDVQHIREGIELHVRETAVQLVLETRSREHAEQVTSAIRRAGYADTRVSR